MRFPLNRSISERITPRLAALRLTPNQVTLISLAAGLLAAWNFFQGSFWGGLFGALWLELSYLLDNCDGELARMTGSVSGLGSWLDTVADCLTHTAFFLALGVGFARTNPNPIWIRAGWFAAGGVFLTYAAFLVEQVQQRGRAAWIHPDPPVREEPSSLAGKLRKVFREDFSLIVLGAVLLGGLRWILWAGLIGSHLHWLATAGGIFLTRRKEIQT